MKAEGQPIREYAEAPETPEQIISGLRKQLDFIRSAYNRARDRANRYDVLRMQEVIIMSPEGARYLRGEELDAYADELRRRVLAKDTGVIAQEVAQAIPQMAVKIA